jgi:isovaleryl-CoA dehydrogenase
MDFELSAEQQMIYDTALAWARKELGPVAAAIDRDDEFPADLWQRLADQGYLGAGIPEEYGGSGGDFLMAALIGQAITRVSPAVALSYGAHLNLCAHNILRNGTPEQRARYLPELATGRMIGALGLTEPNAGSDATGIQMVARPAPGGFRLSGTKMFITNGPIADVIITYAKTAPERGRQGITAFIVETTSPGFRVARKLDKLGMRGSPTGELILEEVFVPADRVLGTVNSGTAIMMSGLDIERAFFSLTAIGLAEEALALALKYAAERTQFGQPIGHFELIQAKLADMYAGIEAGRLLAYRALLLAQTGQRASKEAAAALLFAAQVAMQATAEAVQIHGGYGYIKEFPVERLWRDAELLGIGAGTNEIRRLLIARELLGLR